VTKKDSKQFSQLLIATCQAMQPTRELNPAVLEIYFTALAEYPIEDVRRVLSDIVRTEKFFPVPATIIERITGPLEDNALLALKKFEDAVDRHGPTRSMVFDDHIIHAVVDALFGGAGWEGGCTKTHDEWTWLRKDFVKLYAAYVRTGIRPDQVRPVLIGTAEHGLFLNPLPYDEEINARLTRRMYRRVFIGDRSSAVHARMIGDSPADDKQPMRIGRIEKPMEMIGNLAEAELAANVQ
jgi:hypothetical protein